MGPRISHDLQPRLGPRQLGQLQPPVLDNLDAHECGGFNREEAEKRLRPSSIRLSDKGNYGEEDIFLAENVEELLETVIFRGHSSGGGHMHLPAFCDAGRESS
jgi:hypothetical protein